jgi:hypothetical protein
MAQQDKKSSNKPAAQVKDGNKPAKEKKVKVKRSAFPMPKGVTKLTEPLQFGSFNDKGEYVAAEGAFNPMLHLPLKKTVFENSPDYMDFQAGMLEFKGQTTIQKARSMRNKALKFRTLGDDKQRKAVTKLSKLSKMFAELHGTLEKELGADTLKSILEATKK